MFPLIKEVIDLKDIIAEAGVEIDHFGKALCPFHNDKHPSFSVKGNRWYCFACGEGGDIFDFYQKYFDLTKKEALVELSQRAGVSLENRNSPEIKKKIKDAKERGERRGRLRGWICGELYILSDLLRFLDREADRITPETLGMEWSRFILRSRELLEFQFEYLMEWRRNVRRF